MSTRVGNGAKGVAVQRTPEIFEIPSRMTEGLTLGVLIARDIGRSYDPQSNVTESDRHLIQVYWDATGQAARSTVSENFNVLLQHPVAWIGAHESLALDPVFVGSTEETANPRRPLLAKVAAALKDPRWDFRTVRGIAREVNAPEEAVAEVLDDPPDVVRWVAATNENGEQLLTEASRPVTRREKYLMLRSALTKSLPAA